MRKARSKPDGLWDNARTEWLGEGPLDRAGKDIHDEMVRLSGQRLPWDAGDLLLTATLTVLGHPVKLGTRRSK